MAWSKPLKLLLAIPTVWLAAWGIGWLTMLMAEAPAQHPVIFRGPGLVLHLILLLALLVFYLAYLFTTDRVAGRSKVMWAAALIILNCLAMPLFWSRCVYADSRKAGAETGEGPCRGAVWTLPLAIRLVAAAPTILPYVSAAILLAVPAPERHAALLTALTVGLPHLLALAFCYAFLFGSGRVSRGYRALWGFVVLMPLGAPVFYAVNVWPSGRAPGAPTPASRWRPGAAMRVVLGVATVSASLLVLTFFAASFARVYFGPMSLGDTRRLATAASLSGIPLTFVMVVVYASYLHKTDVVPSRRRVWWTDFLVFGNALAILFFYYRYVLHDPGRPGTPAQADRQRRLMRCERRVAAGLLAAAVVAGGVWWGRSALRQVRIRALHQAIERARHDRGGSAGVAALLQRRPSLARARIERGQDDTWPILHEAIRPHADEVVGLLLTHGADPNAADSLGGAALHKVAQWGPEAAGVAGLLLAHGADANARDKWGRTPLHLAAAGGRIWLADMLLARGAEINARSKDGRTPLHAAARTGGRQMIALLASRRADCNVVDDVGDTPLMSTARMWQANRHRSPESLNRFSNAAGALLEAGADVQAHDAHGNTLLTWAARYGYVGWAELALSYGADPRAVGPQGQDAFRIAEQHGRWALAELLRRHVADQ